LKGLSGELRRGRESGDLHGRDEQGEKGIKGTEREREREGRKGKRESSRFPGVLRNLSKCSRRGRVANTRNTDTYIECLQNGTGFPHGARRVPEEGDVLPAFRAVTAHTGEVRV